MDTPMILDRSFLDAFGIHKIIELLIFGFVEVTLLILITRYSTKARKLLLLGVFFLVTLGLALKSIVPEELVVWVFFLFGSMLLIILERFQVEDFQAKVKSWALYNVRQLFVWLLLSSATITLWTGINIPPAYFAGPKTAIMPTLFVYYETPQQCVIVFDYSYDAPLPKERCDEIDKGDCMKLTYYAMPSEELNGIMGYSVTQIQPYKECK